nr:MAG TPA: hypothetical protein [Caudoviricetes sp.]DAY20743.1 MAG TPA: hypothetical protein [Caudoviricetes sp.]
MVKLDLSFFFCKNDLFSIIYTLCSIEKEIIYFELRLA